MKRILIFALCATLGMLVLAERSHAAQIKRYATKPPVVLSPNLTEPWLLQLKPSRSSSRYVQPRRRARQVGVLPHQRVRAMPRRRTVARPSRTKQRAVRKMSEKFLPQTVSYDSPHRTGTLVIDMKNRYLYHVQSGGQARRYGIGVGRPGFTWTGKVRVARKSEWPSWRPPAEMIKRQPGLPKFMEGGPRNPLGARAMYLYEGKRDTLYRIHGTNEPWTIGHAVSSGCIRMRNEDVVELYSIIKVGTPVVVL